MLRILHQLLFTILLLGFLALVTPVHAATSNAAAGATTNAPTTAPAELVVPRSHFGSVLDGGKDPFYPGSARFQRVIPVTPTNQVATVAPEVQINGFSGNAARPLVIINNVTFGEGDEQMVTTAAGRAQVRCLEIRSQEQTVRIEINGQRRELKFLDRK
jgi:hypothetical protein